MRRRLPSGNWSRDRDTGEIEGQNMQTAAPKRQGDFSVSYTGRGATSKRDVKVTIAAGQPGSGIAFDVLNPQDESHVRIPARASNVVNTLRNVVVGKDGVRLCIVEHVLAAVALWGLEDVLITVDGPELPLGDGSALFWIDLLESAGVGRRAIEATVDLPQPVMVAKKDRMLIAYPDDRFSLTYLMDWNHPLIGKRWRTWDSSMDARDIARARTFASLKEHRMLGLDQDLVSMTDDGFTFPLHFEDEPVRHKLLDLMGDLTLAGLNPIKLKAGVISTKGGHELDVDLAKKLEKLICP